MPLHLLPSLLLLILVWGLTPGPANIYAMGSALRYGFKPALKMWWGLLTGFTIAMTTRSNGLNQLNGSSSSMPSGIFINPSMALDAGAASFPCAAGVLPLSAPA